jgi:hypothetical protein
MTAQIWPGGARAAVSVTMDNMGEASEIEQNTWPADKPLGNHFSVTESLPKMLDLLQQYNIRATYFIEAWNADVYPVQIREVVDRGHEIGCHGFRHEAWGSLDEARERKLLEDSVLNARKLGIHFTGFRPPGGKVTENTLRLLNDYGFSYISPAAKDTAVIDKKIAVLPFKWQNIDAYFYFEPLREMRTASGDSEAPLLPSLLEDRLGSLLNNLVENGGYCSLLFHPNLHNDPLRLASMAHILEQINQDPRIWCAPCNEIASWMAIHPEHFSTEVEYESLTWS